MFRVYCYDYELGIKSVWPQEYECREDAEMDVMDAEMSDSIYLYDREYDIEEVV